MDFVARTDATEFIGKSGNFQYVFKKTGYNKGRIKEKD